MLAQVRAGDAAAYGAFYDATAKLVLAFFYRRVVCPHVAADLSSETFARALEHLHKFDPEKGSALSWLFGIAANLHLDWLRHGRVTDRARRRLGIARVAVDDATLEEIEASVDMLPLREAMRDALGELTPTLREAVVLRVAYGLPYAEVAEKLGVTIDTARVRVSRGMSALHDTLALEPSP